MCIYKNYIITSTGNWGYVKLWKLEVKNSKKKSELNLELYQDFNNHQHGGIQNLAVDAMGKYFFLAGFKGNLIQYNLETLTIHKEWVDLKDGAISVMTIF